MPGFLGCVSTHATVARSTAAHIQNYRGRVLPEHPRYATRDAWDHDGNLVLTLLPRLRMAQSGAYREPEGGVLIYIGRFEQAPFARNGDGAAIARSLWDLYRDRGKAFARDLAGSYLIFLRDPRTRRMLLVNDHYASYQCFYTASGEALCFAPEVGMLVDACALSPSIDLGSALSMFINGQLISCSTYLREIKALEPGSVVEVAPETGIRFDQHYRFAFVEPAGDGPLEAYVGGLRERLMGALESRADILGDTIIPLSGGYDSRGLAACAAEVARKRGTRVRTVTWGVPAGEDVPDDDPVVARRVAEHLGTDHIYVARPTASWVDDFENMLSIIDGLTDDCVFHPNEHALMQRLHDGIGADHVLLGNHMFGPAGPAASDTEALARVGLFGLTEYQPLWSLFAPERLAELRRVSDDYAAQALARCGMKDHDNRKDYLHYMQRLQNYTNHSGHYKQCAIWVHNPWLDRAVVDYMATVPPAYRVNKLLYKRTLTSMFPALAEIPTASGGRPGDIEDWDHVIRTHEDIRRYLTRHLLSEENGLHALLDRDALRAYIDDFLSGRPAAEPPLVMVVNRVKRVMAHYPHIYRLVKRSTMKYLHVRDLPASTVLFRLLILKRIFDRYGARA